MPFLVSALDALAQRVIRDGDANAEEMMAIARNAAAACAARWNWTGKGRAAATILAAAEAGTAAYYEPLGARFSQDRLVGLFKRLSEDDRFAFTFDGSEALTAPARAALHKRVEATLAREGVRPEDFPRIALFFTALARNASTQDYWQRMGEKDER